MSGSFQVLYAFLPKRLARNAACFWHKFTVYQGKNSPRYSYSFVCYVPRAHKIQLTNSTRLASVCYVPRNIRTNYRHLTVFTLNKGYARNVCDFLEDEPLTFFYVIIVLVFLFPFHLLRPNFQPYSPRARAHKDITLRETYKKTLKISCGCCSIFSSILCIFHTDISLPPFRR